MIHHVWIMPKKTHIAEPFGKGRKYKLERFTTEIGAEHSADQGAEHGADQGAKQSADQGAEQSAEHQLNSKLL